MFADDAPTALNVIENTAAGVDIGDPVTATDPERKTVTYELDDGDGAAFEIDDTTGQIKTKASLMDEAQDTYTVTVTASDDDGNEAEHVVTITVTDANDPPEFNDEIPQGETGITRSVAENTAAGEPVGDPVAATDEESDTLTYSLAGTDAASFDIDTTSGQIKIKDFLDFEGGTTRYSVIVSVHDGKDISGNTEDPPNTDATIDVTIEVTDVNEGPTFDANAPATQEVAENTAAETNIGSPYTATDPENDTPLTYSLGGTDAASFEIDTGTGQLKTKADLDHEAKASYSIDVQVADGKNAEGISETPPVVDTTHAVTITVTDADDQGSITLSTQTPTVGSTLTATVVDQDGGVTGETWVWESSTDQNNWTTITGETTNSYTPDSDDVGNYLKVTATYNDDEGSGQTAEAGTSSAVVLRPATNENPEFADATAERSIAENTAAGQNIGAPVTATHGDSVGTLAYSLDTTGADTFDVDSSTGQLKTKTALDHEGISSYTVTVSVNDGMDSYSNADTAVDSRIDVTINVTDINEKPQFAAETISFTIPEDTSVGQSVGNALSATDPDPSDTVTYSASGTDAALFQVDSNGQLQVKEALDYEDGDTLTVVVSATDSRDDSGTTEQTPLPDDTITVTVTLTNVFETPRFGDDDGSGTATRTVPENTIADQPVGLPVSATDDEGDTLTYELSGTDVDSFNFDTATGQIKTKDELDHEDIDTYYVTVSVYDGKASDGSTEDTPVVDTYIDVTIEVEDVNEKPTFDATPPVEYQIAENTAAATPIGVALTATDPDNGGTDPNKDTLTYTLDSDSAATFEIDTSGQIKTLAALDHETEETYNVTVSVRDSRDDAGDPDTADDATIDVTITVTDVDDEPGK